MNSKYKVLKYKSNNAKNIDDLISIEEPLEITIKFKNKEIWNKNIISITMRTPGSDEDLIRGFLFNERIIENLNKITSIEQKGDDVGDYNLKNIIEATLNDTKNLEIGKLKRNFVTNSSCGVCGKTSLDAIEIIKDEKLDISFPKLKRKIIIRSPELLRDMQSEFSKTGGIHASALIDINGKVIAIKEDVGRHNALDKLIGFSHYKKLIDNHSQFIACSGRLNFELVQKALMSNIGIMVGVGAPTSLAIDLAKRFDMTLVGFVKSDSFNIYCNENRVII